MTVSASMPETTLRPAVETAFTVNIEVAEGWSASDAGIPKIFVQLAVPESVELTGRVVETYPDLVRNEFVMEPLERLVDPGETTVGFRVTATPDADDAVAVNVVAYLREASTGIARFSRQRLVLPVRAGARAEPVPADVSSWGTAMSGLQIGDRADPFELPRADGSVVRLEDYLGKRNIIVTTYRAFW